LGVRAATLEVVVRLAAQNPGQNRSTVSGRPWRVCLLMEFDDEARAAAFERFLKSGSGRAFSRKHLS
jgi:hypothetical protein